MLKVGDTFGVEKLRADLKRVYQWSMEWQMLFNVNKCTVMHMGKTNTKCSYNLGNSLLKESKLERGLGVLINCNGKQFEQCSAAVKKANAVLGMIKRNVVLRVRITYLDCTRH
jgi:hypothetical protein